ncbi:tetratricopeptide repeat protein [Phormidium yuhuli AB48]|uniref:protein-glutamate O-methyltransferase n=1 Tax=Phormidium yuhuli AB48 TaxID=2940671 RepID=A0ABY5ARD1_9CYAN|nr:CheR family methyltransferase [Phormidium yuhuli]USR90708.1 tetratricopeptide repeat protein [Phormidium yuhuli AB48]
MFNADWVQRFSRLIARHTGLLIRPQDERNLCKKLEQRLCTLGLSSPSQYYELLRLEVDNPLTVDRQTSASRREWTVLIRRLVVTESYFFRDRGQFELLRSRLLPEILVKRRNIAAQNGQRPQLKIWSAACASGEEPYSLAIVLWELLNDRDHWDLQIIGTDINDESLAVARRGEYSAWSFRQVDASIQRQYFQQQGDRYRLNPEIRRLVTFKGLNLVSDAFPDVNLNLYDLDLILCRNVFIYFEPAAIEQVLEKFYDSLSLGGYLIAAHAELQSSGNHQFHSQLFPQSVVYQRCDRLEHQGLRSLPTQISPPRTYPTPPQTVPLPVLPQPSPIIPLNPVARPVMPRVEQRERVEGEPAHWQEAQQQFQASAYPQAIHTAEQVLSQHPRHVEAYLLIARAYANLGEHQKAVYYCLQALEIDSLAVRPHYLLAHLYDAQGQINRAKQVLKKIIYLAPKMPLAYLELAQIYRLEGDLQRAQRMEESAVNILRSLPPNTPMDVDAQLTAGQLLQQIKNS